MWGRKQKKKNGNKNEIKTMMKEGKRETIKYVNQTEEEKVMIKVKIKLTKILLL
jgi:hypothetical protein